MRTNISVPISMTPDLVGWIDGACKLHGSRSAYVRWLLERERENETIWRIESLEKKVKALEEKTTMKTPQTDALLKNDGNDPYGWIEHARQLETELAAAKAYYQKNDERWIVRENELMTKLEKCRAAIRTTLENVTNATEYARAHRILSEVLEETK